METVRDLLTEEQGMKEMKKNFTDEKVYTRRTVVL